MSAFLIANMAPIMFASLVVVLLLGYPAAFSLGAVGLIYAFVGIQLGEFRPDFLQALPERVYGVMNNDTLLAIPFFTFMGLVLERSGMAEDLLDTIGQLFGTIKGGLAYAVMFVGALLAATTGVVAASVISMGLISLPIMLRYGYDRRVATGIIAASGTLAQIIPPSLVLIILADQLGRSVGDMYKGAFIPGFMLSVLYAGYVFLVTIIKPEAAPALPLEARLIPEDPALHKRQSLLTSLGLLIVGVPLFYLLISLAVTIAELLGLSIALPSNVQWGAGVVLSALVFGRRLVGMRPDGNEDVPRWNTFAMIGLTAILSTILTKGYMARFPEMQSDNGMIWGAFSATGIVYVLALLNRKINLGL